MRIEFTIDELVLIGFDPNDRHAIGDMVERALGEGWAGRDGGPRERGTVDDRRTLANRVPSAVGDAVVTGLRDSLYSVTSQRGVPG